MRRIAETASYPEEFEPQRPLGEKPARGYTESTATQATAGSHLLEKLLRDERRPPPVHLPGLARMRHIGHLGNGVSRAMAVFGSRHLTAVYEGPSAQGEIVYIYSL